MNKKQHAKQLRKANDERRKELDLVKALVYLPKKHLTWLEGAVKRRDGEYTPRTRK